MGATQIWGCWQEGEASGGGNSPPHREGALKCHFTLYRGAGH